MFRVQDTILSEEIATASFSCDLPKCKGACCVVGDAGAPVSEEEITKLENVFEVLKDDLRPQARKAIAQQGLVKGNGQDGFELTCVDGAECVFVSYNENEIAYCTIQAAFLEGKVQWEKPLSCHLFPLRLKKFGDIEYANFEYVDQLCSAACLKGQKEGKYLSEFLKKPLLRRYGKEWYNDFVEACEEIRIENREAISL